MTNIFSTLFAGLLLLVTMQSTGFFFFKLKVKFIEWLFFNPCAISNVTFLIGYMIYAYSGNRSMMHLAILPMFFFGTLGMFFLPWRGMNFIPQIGHMVMTANILLAIYSTIRQENDTSFPLGLLAGIVIFSPFIALQQKYTRDHPEKFENILIKGKKIT